MKKKKTKNPLMRRIPREFLGDWRKYLVVSLFLILMIGFVSGMYVANGSMMTAATEGVSKYKLEHGHFELNQKASSKLLSDIRSGEKADVKQYYIEEARNALEETFSEEIQTKIDATYADAEERYQLDDPDFQAVPVHIYENFYRNENEDNNNDGITDGTVRIYETTDAINLACLMDGRFPESGEEIAIDRMHADNTGIETGDTITVGKKTWTVVGLLAYVNYSTLHEKSTDFMFDALKFNVAMVTKEGFERLNSSIHYAYAWQYENKPEDEKEEKSLSDDFLKALLTQTVVNDVELENYLPRYANPAVNFATEDMGSDKAMGGVLLDILIVIIAFIFAVTISNTIVRESQAIGTLRALGYTRGELIRHYLTMPVIVTLLAAAIGNLLGYTLFKYTVVSMYYNSYSLPAYETVWNPEAFVKTTLIPVILMFVVNLIVIVKMLHHTPLQFLRHDLKKSRRKKAVRLPQWRFFHRFRLRIMFQNVPNYLILFFGIFFISVMLAMAVGLPDTLNYYQTNAKDMMFARYQYILNDSDSVTTENKDAEPFDVYSLQRKGDALDEEISVYGIADDSRYVQIADLKSLKENQVYISSSFGDKYNLKTGDTFLLDEKYENKQYSFEIAGFYDTCLSLAVFMPEKNFQTLFELDEDEFSGYLSDTELKDIGEDKIATVITERDITKMCDQLNHSMGSYMYYFQVLCILLSAVMIYLLTKIIIEKNENAISMTKILGYENREIAGLYLLSTTIILVIADATNVVLGTLVMCEAWKAIMSGYSGWFTFMIQPVGYAKMFAFVLIGYLIVIGFDFKRIKKIPMDQALKNVE